MGLQLHGLRSYLRGLGVLARYLKYPWATGTIPVPDEASLSCCYEDGTQGVQDRQAPTSPVRCPVNGAPCLYRGMVPYCSGPRLKSQLERPNAEPVLRRLPSPQAVPAEDQGLELGRGISRGDY